MIALQPVTDACRLHACPRPCRECSRPTKREKRFLGTPPAGWMPRLESDAQRVAEIRRMQKPREIVLPAGIEKELEDEAALAKDERQSYKPRAVMSLADSERFQGLALGGMQALGWSQRDLALAGKIGRQTITEAFRPGMMVTQKAAEKILGAIEGARR